MATRTQCRAEKIASRIVATLLEHIDYKNLTTLWYENEAGDKYVPPMSEIPVLPVGFIYQHSRFPTVLHESVLRITGGGSKEIIHGESSWSDDLVLALTTKKGLTLSEAILVAVTSCERCMNVLADECGLSWGYAWGSEAWRKSNTECDFCREGPRIE